MAEIAQDIHVEEVMNSSPVTGDPGMTALEAATLIRERGVGSLVIVEEEGPVGILTEKDLVEKVVAENRKSSKVKVTEIMSSPLVTATPNDKVSTTAEKMANMRIRRLPVVNGGELVGIITENDILKISPSLIEITREWARINSGGPSHEAPTITSGYCEICGSYSDMLTQSDGRLLCGDCLELEK
jgi:CBS domain-containing protein